MANRTITVQTYETEEGTPTCCLCFESGKQCEFLGFRSFGLKPVCMLGEQVNLHCEGAGFIRPHGKCRLHYASNTAGTVLPRKE